MRRRDGGKVLPHERSEKDHGKRHEEGEESELRSFRTRLLLRGDVARSRASTSTSVRAQDVQQDLIFGRDWGLVRLRIRVGAAI